MSDARREGPDAAEAVRLRSCWRRVSVSSTGVTPASRGRAWGCLRAGSAVGRALTERWYRPWRTGLFIRTARGAGRKCTRFSGHAQGAAGSAPRGRGSASSDSWTLAVPYPGRRRSALLATPPGPRHLADRGVRDAPETGPSPAALYPSTTLNKITRITIPWATIAIVFPCVFQVPGPTLAARGRGFGRTIPCPAEHNRSPRLPTLPACPATPDSPWTGVPCMLPTLRSWKRRFDSNGRVRSRANRLPVLRARSMFDETRMSVFSAAPPIRGGRLFVPRGAQGRYRTQTRGTHSAGRSRHGG